MNLSGRATRKIIVGAGVLLVALVAFAYNSIDIASQTIRFRLEALGASIYEYRGLTGRWPARADDLSGTSMALRLRYWQEDIQTGRVVVVWPRDWKTHPPDNRDRILAYHTSGLLANFGWQWVCWGDLRTEYLLTKKLQAALKSASSR